jgi:hypothetical protein
MRNSDISHIMRNRDISHIMSRVNEKVYLELQGI